MGKKTPPFWDLNRIVSVCSLFVSACALIFFVVQTRIAREQQYAAVRPIVYWSASSDYSADSTQGRFEMHVMNKGLGPAIIKKIDFYYDGQSFKTSELTSLVQKMLKTQQQPSYRFKDIERQVLMAGENIELFKFTDPTQGWHFTESFQSNQSAKFDIVITFSDLYGNCWQTRRGSKVTDIGRCPPEEPEVPDEDEKN